MIDSYPYLPIEDEGRLLNFTIREHYYTVIFTLADFRENVMNGNMKSLIDFHSKNKYLLMAYSQTGLKKLGSIAANHGKKSFADLIKEYSSLLYSTLSTKPSRGRYINVMLHILGYFKNELSSAEKALFLDLLEQYRNSRIPQSSVFTLLGSWGVRFDARYLTDQTIFRPFPVELATVLDSGKGR